VLSVLALRKNQGMLPSRRLVILYYSEVAEQSLPEVEIQDTKLLLSVLTLLEIGLQQF
jgi:hypothetical protein